MIRASVELMSTTDQDRPRGVKSSQASTESQEGGTPTNEAGNTGEDCIPGQSDAKRARKITQEEKEDAMLPDLKPMPGNYDLLILYYCRL